MSNHFGRPATPGASRGILPLIIAAGAARAAYGAINANQTKQRNKGYISAAYRDASAKLALRQGDVAQSTAESLNARGLSQGGDVSVIRAAMSASDPTKPQIDPNAWYAKGIPKKPATAPAPYTAAPTTLAGQVQSDLGREFNTERTDLDEATKRALNENSAAALNEQLGAVASGVQTAVSAYGDASNLAALRSAAGAAAGGAPTAARQAYMTGVDDPANTWGGIHPIDPLNAPGSSWNRNRTIIGDGQANDAFNVG